MSGGSEVIFDDQTRDSDSDLPDNDYDVLSAPGGPQLKEDDNKVEEFYQSYLFFNDKMC
jgi:hypothetical protein